MRHPILWSITALLLAVMISSCITGNAGLSGQSIASEYYAIAEGYAELSKFDKAILYYRKAALRKEYANAANYGLGRMYALSGRWQQACDTFAGLHTKDPDNTLIASAYAYALASNGQTTEALALYKTVWRNNPGDPGTGRNYAAMLVLALRYEDALSLIAELKKSYPDIEEIKDLGELKKKAADALTPSADIPETVFESSPEAIQ